MEEKKHGSMGFYFQTGFWYNWEKKRIYYERMFINIKARVLGILSNKVINSNVFARKFYNKFKLGNKKSDLWD